MRQDNQPEMKKPRRLVHVGASENNVETSEVNNVMSKNSIAVSNVIPFDFCKKQVRAMLIDDQPWFCAADVCAVLGYANSRKAIADNCREAGVTASDISSGGQKRRVTFISEGNLYRLIIKSRKEEAQRFESWVCDEVLPAIRKHGRYEDNNNHMPTLMDELIGMSELSVIKGLIRDKAKAVPADKRQSFAMTMHSRLHTRFNVPRTELIPAGQFEPACNFIAAYAIEGEWLPKAEQKCGAALDDYQLYDVLFVMSHFTQLYQIVKHSKLLDCLKGLGSRIGVEMRDHLVDGQAAVHRLHKLDPEFDAAQRRLRINQYGSDGMVVA